MVKLHNLLKTAFTLFVCSSSVFANTLDSNINYYINGKSVAPWDMSLAYGKVILAESTGKTVMGSLMAKPASKKSENDALRLTWNPRGVKTEWGTVDKNVLTATLTNTQAQIDLSPVVQQAALAIDVKVIKRPKKLVDLTMECGWNWKCRSTIPLKEVLRKLPKKKWVTLPIPLRCFSNDNFDMSKVTSIMQLQTAGKMELELGDIRLTAFPADKVTCPGE